MVWPNYYVYIAFSKNISIFDPLQWGMIDYHHSHVMVKKLRLIKINLPNCFMIGNWSGGMTPQFYKEKSNLHILEQKKSLRFLYWLRWNRTFINSNCLKSNIHWSLPTRLIVFNIHRKMNIHICLDLYYYIYKQK